MSTARTTARSAPTGAATESTKVRRLVSGATLALLLMLTIASVANIRDMAEATHAAAGLASLLVAVAIGGTLSVLAYVASITDGSTRTLAASFATFAAVVSTSLQVSLFLERGAGWPVALAFGAGVPFFEIALALTDSMLRRYVEPQSHAAAAQLAPQVTTQAHAETTASATQAPPQLAPQAPRKPARKPAPQKPTPAQRQAQIAESGVTDPAAIAAQFRISVRTAQNDLAVVRSTTITTNGSAK